jgi:hypothetical protein
LSLALLFHFSAVRLGVFGVWMRYLKKSTRTRLGRDLLKGEFREFQEISFNWTLVGDIGQGRLNLGSQMDVETYRL